MACRIAGCDQERVPGQLWCPRHSGAVAWRDQFGPRYEWIAEQLGPGVYLPGVVNDAEARAVEQYREQAPR